MMALGPDEIPESALVTLVDRLNRTTRRKWADKGLLRKKPRGTGYSEHDAAELAAFFQLHKELGDYYDAVAAWNGGVRDALRKAIAEDRENGTSNRLIALFDAEAQQGTLVTAEEEIGSYVMRRKRRDHFFRAIDLSDRVSGAREAFWRAVEARNLRPDSPSSVARQGVPDEDARARTLRRKAKGGQLG
jgi:hypothetical protein